MLACALALAPTDAHAEKLRDLVSVAGARDNQLIGYGVVTGLGGTGDDTLSGGNGNDSLDGALGNDSVLVPASSKRLIEKCRAEGLTVYDPDVSMIGAGGGAVHCMCQALRRESVG